MTTDNTTLPDDGTPDGTPPTTDSTTEPRFDALDLLVGAAYGCPVEVLNWYVDALIKGVAAASIGSVWSETHAAFPTMVTGRLMDMGVSTERVVMVTCAATIGVDLAQAVREAFPPDTDDSLTSTYKD